MRKLFAYHRLRRTLLFSVVLVSLILPLLAQLGMQFGSEMPGGPGLHFAQGFVGSHLVRFDAATLGLALFVAVMTVVYMFISNSRFVLLLGATTLLAGLSLGVQIIPEPGLRAAGGYGGAAVWVTSLGRLSAAALMLLGGLMIRFGNARRILPCLLRVLAPGVAMLALTWWSMAHGPVMDGDGVRNLNLATAVLYCVTALLFNSDASYARLRLFGQGALGALIPMALGQIGLTFFVHTHLDSAYQIATLLQWFAFLLPGGGLIVDTLNAIHARGLIRERRYLRSVIDAIPHFIFARDAEGRFTLVNRAVADFYGMKVHQVEGRHLADIHPDPEQVEEWLQEDRQTLEMNQEWVVPQTETRTATGESIWIRARKKPLPVEPGQTPQVLGVSIDYTEEKRAQLALAERMKMEKAASEIHEAFALCTPETFGHNMSLILGVLARFLQSERGFVYRFDEETRDVHLIHEWTALEPEPAPRCPPLLGQKDMEWLLRRFESDIPVSPGTLAGLPNEAAPFREAWNRPEDTGFLAVPIFHQGKLYGFLGLDSLRRKRWQHKELGIIRMVIDLFVTVWSKHEVERSLVLAIEAAEASNRAKTEFLANMSHEIRTPLNAVLGITDLLLELDPTAMQRQYLEMVQTSGDALLTLINDLLDLAKIESGKLELDPHDVTLQELVDEVINLSAINAQTRGLELISRVGPDVPPLAQIDGTRVRQVLLNLMSNAIKFTKEGYVRLDVEAVAGQSSGQNSGPNSGPGAEPQLRFAVRDTGIGIDATGLRKIFEKFTQADASTTRRFGGTGLGLNISRQLVHLMGGEIAAESKPGEGSTFQFTVPLVPSANRPEPAPAFKGEALLIHAFEPGARVLAERLERLGLECRLALNEEEARKQLQRLPGRPAGGTNIVLVDSDLESLLHEDLRQAVAACDVPPPMVLMSNMSDARRELNLAERGYSDVLPKPVLQSHLLRVLRADYRPAIEPGSAPQKIGATPAQPVRTGDGGEKPLVLLVEDNLFNQKVGVGILELLGCRVEVAGNGIEAVEQTARTRYDLIFMDCQMPEMDGYEATRRIRRQEEGDEHVTIIAMTANTMQSDRDACFAAGMDDFLSKPVGRARLEEMLGKWQQVPEEAGS